MKTRVVSDTAQLLRRLGVHSGYLGFHYAQLAVWLCWQDPEYLLSITKKLYPDVAVSFHTTPQSVERNIRTLIDVCWERGDRLLLSQISGHTLKQRPSVRQFIDIVLAYLTEKNGYNPMAER